MRKAQAQEMFVYLLAIVVVVLILVFGYRAITGMKKQAEDVSFVQLKTQLTNSIRSMSSDYGSVSIKELEIGTKYTHLCFGEVGNTQGIDTEFTELQNADMSIIRDSLQSKVEKNVFLYPDGSDSIYVGEIIVDDGTDDHFMCIPAAAGRLKVRIEGLGNKAKLSRAS